MLLAALTLLPRHRQEVRFSQHELQRQRRRTQVVKANVMKACKVD